MNTSSYESDDLSEADERLRRLIAHSISPCDAAQLSDEQVESLLHEPTDSNLSDDQMELILRKAEAKIRSASETAGRSEAVGQSCAVVPPVADASLAPAAAPTSPVLGFLGGVTDLSGSFTPTFWTLLVMVSGIALTLSLVIVLVVRGIHVQVDVPDGGRQFADDNRANVEKSRDTQVAVAPGPASPSPVARLARADGRWTSSKASIRLGSGLWTGQKLDLASGEAEIVFQTGAVAVLRGPAKLEIDSPNSVRLVIGCLSVRADTPVARGFTVHSGSASLIDLGTEFHVRAAAEGHSEVYVTVGAVEVRAASRRPPPCAQCRTVRPD